MATRDGRLPVWNALPDLPINPGGSGRMSQTVWITMGAALGVGIGWLLPLLYLRRRRAAADPISTPIAATQVRDPAADPARTADRRPAAASRARSFHGVSLKPGPDACAAVHTVIDRRYLSNDAPALPLAGCNRERCECTYGHYTDRRDEEDRRSGWGSFGGFAASVPGGNRRDQRPDRRLARSRTRS